MTNKIQIKNEQNVKQKFDLEERTLLFAKNCINIVKTTRSDLINLEINRQLVRASGSVGANYREANDATTIKSFCHKIGICRMESKESKYWLELFLHANKELGDQIKPLIDEAF